MSTLILLGVTIFSFVAFVVILRVEAFQDVRFFGAARTRFDRFTTRIGFILVHVDFSAFTWQLVKDSSMHVLHIVLHLLLLGIRFIERTLTRTVRVIRVQKAETESDDSLKTTSDFFKKVASRTKGVILRKKEKEGVTASEATPHSDQ